VVRHGLDEGRGDRRRDLGRLWRAEIDVHEWPKRIGIANRSPVRGIWKI